MTLPTLTAPRWAVRISKNGLGPCGPIVRVWPSREVVAVDEPNRAVDDNETVWACELEPTEFVAGSMTFASLKDYEDLLQQSGSDRATLAEYQETLSGSQAHQLNAEGPSQ